MIKVCKRTEVKEVFPRDTSGYVFHLKRILSGEGGKTYAPIAFHGILFSFNRFLPYKIKNSDEFVQKC